MRVATSWSKAQTTNQLLTTFTVAFCSDSVTTLGSGAKYFAALEEKGARPSKA